jgi:hypothetical protein
MYFRVGFPAMQPSAYMAMPDGKQTRPTMSQYSDKEIADLAEAMGKPVSEVRELMGLSAEEDRFETPSPMATPSKAPDSQVTAQLKDFYETFDQTLMNVARSNNKQPQIAALERNPMISRRFFSMNFLRAFDQLNEVLAMQIGDELPPTQNEARYTELNKIFSYVHALTLLLYRPVIAKYLFYFDGTTDEEAADGVRARVFYHVHTAYTLLGKHFSRSFSVERSRGSSLEKICGNLLGGMPSVYMWYHMSGGLRPAEMIDPNGILARIAAVRRDAGLVPLQCPPVILGFLDPEIMRDFYVVTRGVRYPMMFLNDSGSVRFRRERLAPILLQKYPATKTSDDGTTLVDSVDIAREQLFGNQNKRVKRLIESIQDYDEIILGWYERKDSSRRYMTPVPGEKGRTREFHPMEKLKRVQTKFETKFFRDDDETMSGQRSMKLKRSKLGDFFNKMWMSSDAPSVTELVLDKESVDFVDEGYQARKQLEARMDRGEMKKMKRNERRIQELQDLLGRRQGKLEKMQEEIERLEESAGSMFSKKGTSQDAMAKLEEMYAERSKMEDENQGYMNEMATLTMENETLGDAMEESEMQDTKQLKGLSNAELIDMYSDTRAPSQTYDGYSGSDDDRGMGGGSGMDDYDQGMGMSMGGGSGMDDYNQGMGMSMGGGYAMDDDDQGMGDSSFGMHMTSMSRMGSKHYIL